MILLDISDEDASVSSGDMKSQEGDSGSGADSNAGSTDDGSVDGTPGEAVLTNGSVSSVVSQAKVSREQVRSKNKETLQNIIDNKNLSAEAINNQAIGLTDILLVGTGIAHIRAFQFTDNLYQMVLVDDMRSDNQLHLRMLVEVFNK